jgi:hypothetical protein
MARRLALSTRLSRAHQRVIARTRPGTGARFASLVQKLRQKGAKNPRALAAFIGRKKYGKTQFQRMALAGRRRG